MRRTIQTERLSLRPLSLADAPRVSVFTSDFDVARMTGAIPCPNPVVAVEGWLLILAARRPLGRDYVYGLDLQGEGLIGTISAIADGEGGYKIGYWLGRPYWGEGFATEAARAVAEEASLYGPLSATHYVDNPASGRVLEKAGFAYTGAQGRIFSVARGRSDPALYMRRAARRMAA